ncbi:WHG domain-containing protein [Actinoallomurus purpureus]|uniref:TetR/AcrR family transcriptional regulator n=1 Tax=Actinoallomurus purpureus TaxID=478114 RepID=UPI002092E5A0|nr:TetR family transcriptional regulator [Actinoallomurus purpureus]MCO6010416.1 WHG domain-containing protein [Actinoallomurus purpureus]
MTTRRERLRAELDREIRASAHRLLRADGPAAMTLAAIAREVGITAPAIYRYYESHDDLVRAVASDLVEDLVATLTAAADPSYDLLTRLTGATNAIRTWALEHPAEFAFLFGSPNGTSGRAQGEISAGWVVRLAHLFGGLFEELWRQRPFAVIPDAELAPALRDELAAYRRTTGLDLPLGAIWILLTCWHRIYAAVCLEIFGHLGVGIDDHGPLFDQMLVELVASLGLVYEPPAR